MTTEEPNNEGLAEWEKVLLSQKTETYWEPTPIYRELVRERREKFYAELGLRLQELEQKKQLSSPQEQQEEPSKQEVANSPVSEFWSATRELWRSLFGRH